MSKQAAILDQARTRHKRPCELTDHEVFLLMRAYTADKTCITEADALTLCHWAQAQKFGAYVLQLVLAGRLHIVVKEQEIRLRGLPVEPKRGGGGEQTQGNGRQR